MASIINNYEVLTTAPQKDLLSGVTGQSLTAWSKDDLFSSQDLKRYGFSGRNTLV